MNDFKYVDQFFCRVADKEKKLGHQAINHEEDVVLAVWHTTGLISNGGLQNYFIWEGANPAVAESFAEVGLGDAAQIIREFFLLFPSVDFANFTSAKRDHYMQEHIVKVKSKVDILNQKFDELMPMVEVKTTVFIRKYLDGILH